VRGIFFSKSIRFKLMSLLTGFFLAACAVGGGGEDPFSFNTGGGGTNGACDTSTSGIIDNSGGSVESEDGKVSIIINPGAIQLGAAVEVVIAVRCGLITFNGFGYDVIFTGNPPNFSIVIAYENSEIPAGLTEANLALGTLSTGPEGFDEIANAPIGNNQASADGLNVDGVFGIFIKSIASGGSPPTPPSNVQAVSRGPACRIDITWDPSQDPDGDLSSYTIFRGNNSIGAIAFNQAGCCIFSDSNLLPIPLPRGNHRYFIRANDTAEHTSDSLDSNIVAAPSSCP
jgi:hypothetical protein